MQLFPNLFKIVQVRSVANAASFLIWIHGNMQNSNHLVPCVQLVLHHTALTKNYQPVLALVPTCVITACNLNLHHNCSNISKYAMTKEKSPITEESLFGSTGGYFHSPSCFSRLFHTSILCRKPLCMTNQAKEQLRGWRIFETEAPAKRRFHTNLQNQILTLKSTVLVVLVLVLVC